MPEETPVNFAKFLRTPLLQNNSGRLLLKCGHFNGKARDIDCICSREELDVYIVGKSFGFTLLLGLIHVDVFGH